MARILLIEDEAQLRSILNKMLAAEDLIDGLVSDTGNLSGIPVNLVMSSINVVGAITGTVFDIWYLKLAYIIL